MAKFRLKLKKVGKTTKPCWIMEKAREFQKNIYFYFIDYTEDFDCVDHNKLWKILQEGNIRPPDLPPEKSVGRSRSNSQNQTLNNRLVPNCERNTSRPYTVILLRTGKSI